MRTLSNVKGLDNSENSCFLYSLAQVMMINRMSAVIRHVLAIIVTSRTSISTSHVSNVLRMKLTADDSMSVVGP